MGGHEHILHEITPIVCRCAHIDLSRSGGGVVTISVESRSVVGACGEGGRWWHLLELKSVASFGMRARC